MASRKKVPWGHGTQSSWKAKDPRDVNADNPATLTPAGRLNATVEAWAQFLRIFLDYGYAHEKLGLRRETWVQLRTSRASQYTRGGMIAAGPRGWCAGPDTGAIMHVGSNTMNACVCWLGGFESKRQGEVAIMVLSNQGDTGLLDPVCEKLLRWAGLL